MKRVLLTLIVVAGIVATAALAAGSHTITKTSIGKGKLGKTKAVYKKAYGKPRSVDNLEGGFTRLAYPHRVEVYFKTGGSRGRYIVVTSKLFKTTKGIGPCSKAKSVKKAYPAAVKVKLAGTEYAYRLGKKLWLEVEGKKIAAAALGSGKQTAWIASNSPSCGS
jgi:hypothetical protein